MIPPEIAMIKIIAAESDTVHEYRKILSELECPQCRKVVESIIDEEVVHLGEALANFKRVCPHYAEKLTEGELEGVEIAKSMLPNNDLGIEK